MAALIALFSLRFALDELLKHRLATIYASIHDNATSIDVADAALERLRASWVLGTFSGRYYAPELKRLEDELRRVHIKPLAWNFTDRLKHANIDAATFSRPWSGVATVVRF